MGGPSSDVKQRCLRSPLLLWSYRSYVADVFIRRRSMTNERLRILVILFLSFRIRILRILRYDSNHPMPISDQLQRAAQDSSNDTTQSSLIRPSVSATTPSTENLSIHCTTSMAKHITESTTNDTTCPKARRPSRRAADNGTLQAA